MSATDTLSERVARFDHQARHALGIEDEPAVMPGAFVAAAAAYADWHEEAADVGLGIDPFEAWDAAHECQHGRVPAEGCSEGCFGRATPKRPPALMKPVPWSGRRLGPSGAAVATPAPVVPEPVAKPKREPRRTHRQLIQEGEERAGVASREALDRVVARGRREGYSPEVRVSMIPKLAWPELRPPLPRIQRPRVPLRTAKRPTPGWEEKAAPAARPEGEPKPAVVVPAAPWGKTSQLLERWIEEAREGVESGATLLDVARTLWAEEEARARYASQDSFYQALQRARRNGWTTKRAAPEGMARYRGRLPEHLLYEAAFRYYIDEWGFQRIARWMGRRFPEARGLFANVDDGLTNGLHQAFVRLGWPRRDRIEATNIASYKHGLAPRKNRPDDRNYRRQLKAAKAQPRCKATVVAKGKRHGARCPRPAKTGIDYCPSHDPATADARAERLARMRSKQDLLEREPFTRWLIEERARFRTQGEAAAALGLDTSVLGRWLNGEDAPVKRSTVIRTLEAAGRGTALEDLYGEQRAA